MTRWQRKPATWVALSALTLLVPTMAYGAGFGIFEQGAKGMGMAGAFTAQANDPSLLFHNAGGLAFVEKQQFSTGFTWIHVNGSEFEGADPFPGEGVRENLKDLDVFPPHVYYLRPLGRTWKFGLALNSPFGLSTEWENPDTFTGRFISQRAELQVIDINPTIGVLLTQNFGLGVGLVGRFSTVELERNVPFRNPFTGTTVDIASVELESDMDTGIGWNIGILHKVGSALSWGLSYRSKVKVDYSGDGVFTQISTGFPPLDAVIAGQLPFGVTQPIETSIEFPDLASLGVAFNLTDNLLAEVDINWTGWSSFDDLPLIFVNLPERSDVIPQGYDDAYNYRLGFNYTTAGGSQWRFGYGFDESPQPDESVGPLLPDSDRNVLTLGYGTASGKLDLAVMFLESEERSTSTNRDGFNGTYNTDALLIGVTYNW